MGKRRSDSPDLGHKFAKSDMERVGLFSEMPYLSGKVYKEKKVRDGANFIGGGYKIKDGTQIGYFEREFKRIFSKEALKGRGRKPPPSKYKNVSKNPFMPPPGFKLHSTPGDYYGCFNKFDAFSGKAKRKPAYKTQPKNFLTGPAKVGGPGYVDNGLSRYPEHKADGYEVKPKYKQYGKILDGPMVTARYPSPYFEKNPYADPPTMKPGRIYIQPKGKEVEPIEPGFILPTGKAKSQGGCHAGCFDKWPEHKADRTKFVSQVETFENIYYPPPHDLKSYYNTSIVQQRVDIKVNNLNYTTYEPDYGKYL